MLMISSLVFSQEFPLLFTNENQLFAGVGGAATAIVSDPEDSANQVLSVAGNGAPYDTAQLNLAANLNLADDNANTITFRVKPLADYGTRTHLLKYETAGPGGGAGATELSFSTSGTDWQNISINFGSGLGNYKLMVIFPDFGNAQVGTYLFDDFVGGSNIAPPAPPTINSPTPPNRLTADVASIYSDAYTSISPINTDAGWCGASSVIATTAGGVGNNILAYKGNPCQGITFPSDSRNLTGYTNIHVDLFIATGTDLIGKIFNLKIVPTTGGGAAAVEIPIDINGISPKPVPGSWYSYDRAFTNSELTKITANPTMHEFGVTSNLNNVVWYDNLYIYKATVVSGTPVIGALTVPAKNTGDADFDLVDPTSDSPGAFTYTSSNTLVATISGKTVTVVGAGTSVITATQAASGSFIEGSVTANLVVTAVPTEAAPTPPNRNAGDVLSIFSAAYTNETLSELPTSWSDLTAFSKIQVAGDEVWKMTGCEFLGMVTNYTTGVDLSAMEKMHIDYFTPDSNPIGIKIVNTINGGESIASLGTTVTGSWRSVDIDMATFTSNKTKITQILIDPTGRNTLYIDNFYFYKAAVVSGTPVIGALAVPAKNTGDAAFDLVDPTSDSPGAFTYTSSNTLVATISGKTVTVVGAGTSVITATQAASGSFIEGNVTANLVVTAVPTEAAPTPPNRNAGDVVSLFSNAYSNITIDNWAAAPIWYAPTGKAPSDVQIASNDTKKVAFPGFIGVDFSTLSNHIDLTTMERFHIDIWIESATLDKSFNLKLVNFKEDNSGELNFTEFSTTNASNPALPNPNPGTWISLDMPLSAWTAGANGVRNNIAQFIITSDLGTVYFDNLYLYKEASLGTAKSEKSNLKVYPNPATTNVTIEANNTIERVSIFNILGQEVLSKNPKANSTSLDISNLQKGTYILRTTSEGKTETTKVLKK